ncbi:tRNA threonylcarbamoyladenosine biosynthesis protein TsaE [bioreactor metagenome]|uniref:tRNA threonylcarbamoyladenosine biosynthesis protein TsaE n=1 Tax=bioreactor metagenome TaxID=1076179 RepID=A0A645GE48_9ZZZZ
MIKITTYSASETKLLGIRLAELLSPGKLLILTGDLGAGKTTFTQGLAQGIGITKTVTSPTFTIMKVYKGPLPLYHIDA